MRRFPSPPFGLLTTVTIAALLLTATIASAQGTTCPSDWQFEDTHPDVDECFGNCGAGCSNSINPCNDGQGWLIDEFYGPKEEMYYTGSIEYCDGEYRCTSSCSKFRYPGHFTYHGWYSDGCYLHDMQCRSGDPGCYMYPPFVCDGQHPETWPYSGYIYAIDITDTECVYAYPECPEIQGDEPRPEDLTLDAQDVARRLLNGEVLADDRLDAARRALTAMKPPAPPQRPAQESMRR